MINNPANNMCFVALDAASRGFKVLPVCPNTKIPMLKKWTEKATSDPNEINKMWKDSPKAMVGIATGVSSGVYVLDADEGVQGDGQPKNGIQNLKSVMDKLGVDLEKTLQVKTPSGGRHYYFKMPLGVDLRNTQSDLEKFVDSRGNGGMIIWAGSVKSDGKKYEFVNQNEIQEMPAALIGHIKNKYSSSKSVEFSKIWNNNIPASKRNSTLTSIAGSLRRFGAETEVIKATLELINNSYCTPPLAQEDIINISNSMLNYNPSYTDTSVGNAERLRDLNIGQILYCSELNSWLIWDGKRWMLDKTLNIQEFAKEIGFILKLEVQALKENGAIEKEFKRKYGFAIRTLDNPTKFLQLAKSDPAIAVTSNQLDNNPYMINCQNGILDLKAGALLPHDAKYRMTKIIPANYNPEAECPNFMKAINYWFNDDQEMVDFMARVVGMGLTGDTSEQKLVKLLGNGKNGKSVFAEVVSYLAGDYGSQTRSEVFLRNTNGGVHNYIAEMKGCRFIFSSEFPQGAKINTAFIKEVTGGEQIKGRQLYQQSITFKPEFLFITSTNWLWLIEGEDNAVTRRLIIIHFAREIPEEIRDKELVSKLKAEIDGILAWAVRGCLDWQKNGLRIPQSVIEQVENFSGSMNLLEDFINEKCIVDPNGSAPASDFHNAYNHWLQIKQESQVSARLFKTIAARKFKHSRNRDGARYLGVSIKPSDFR